MTNELLKKWETLITACKNYYVDSIPTGMLDAQYDELERRAVIEDNFYVRDYVFQTFLTGIKTKNAYIEKIKKEKVTGTMLDAILKVETNLNKKLYCDLKYDGSSLAIYLDPLTGTPKRIVTVGNLNLNDFGVDQTWKLIKFLPHQFPKGIVAIQAEALVDISRFDEGDPEKARQKANGLINSKHCTAEVNHLLTIRGYRYYTDESVEGLTIRNSDYREVLKKFPIVKSPVDGHILFAPADVWTVEELKSIPGFCELDRTTTSTGTFLNDGWVLYDECGICQGALKYSGAGQGDAVIKTTVRSIQWNDQTPKGKDSWSANVIIDPIQIKGTTIRKPSAGSVSKLVKSNITPSAEVSIILANSTIPMIGDVFSPGNGDFMWPTCKCGYKLSDKDVFGSNLKCGNPFCSERLNRMRAVVSGYRDIHKDLDLNEFLIIDRFKWEATNVDINSLLSFVENNDETGYRDYLLTFMKTDLQKRNLNLVWKASFIVLKEVYDQNQRF